MSFTLAILVVRRQVYGCNDFAAQIYFCTLAHTLSDTQTKAQKQHLKKRHLTNTAGSCNRFFLMVKLFFDASTDKPHCCKLRTAFIFENAMKFPFATSKHGASFSALSSHRTFSGDDYSLAAANQKWAKWSL